ncbi:MAG: TM2 domain-containing protein [Defluviitaleaceae bacterium]|nr:TM2 domain-containing protein [Defluviitaleaceae bacterium]
MHPANNRASMWLMAHNGYFKPEHMVYVSEQLNNLPDEHANLLLSLQLKNPTTILLFSIFLGTYGVDRFLLNDIGLGVGKLLTLGGCGIWWLVDLFMVQDRARARNYEILMGALGYQAAMYGQSHHHNHHHHNQQPPYQQ